MSFLTLLFLLSLIIVVPIFFILKERSHAQQKQHAAQHQQFIKAKVDTDKQEKAKVEAPDKLSTKIINFDESHPFIILLCDETVPATFRRLMAEIGQQYELTHHYQISNEQLFTLNKLIEQRLPELLQDYLSIDPEYAKTAVVDTQNAATSYDVVLNQLEMILQLTQQLNEQSQGGAANKLLASRHYLDSLYQESGMANNVLKLK